MKTRLGFVSNSSSASFTLVTTEAAHLQALTSIPPEHAAIIKEIAGKKVIGLDELVVVACYFDDDGSTYNRIGCWTGLGNTPSKRQCDRKGDPDLAAVINSYHAALGENCISGSIVH